MTKLRDPLTIEDALFRVLGTLGVKEAAKFTGRSTGYLRSLSDPDKREQLTVRDLRLLDLAHDASFGTGFPLLEALGRDMGSLREARFADHAAIGRCAVELAHENGEAVAALLDVVIGSADDPKQLRAALREAEESAMASNRAVTVLRAAIDRLEPEGSAA